MERVVWGEGLQWHFTPNSNSIQRMLFCVHYLRRCHITSTRSPCRSNCIPGTPYVFISPLLSTSLIVLSELEIYSNRFFVYYFILLFLCITFYRLLFRFCIQLYRSRGGNFRTVLYLGSTENIAELYHEMTSDALPDTGYWDTSTQPPMPSSLPVVLIWESRSKPLIT